LMSAVVDQPSAIQTLIDAGADLNAFDEERNTVLMHAVMDRPSAIQTLIDAGANVNAVDPNDVTALKIAIGRNNQEAIRILRAAGARE